MLSVFVHGVSATPLSSLYARHVQTTTLAEEREGTFTGLFDGDPNGADRITPAELALALASGSPPIVLDVRSRAQYEADDIQIPTSIRVQPDQIEDWATTASKQYTIVAYCT